MSLVEATLLLAIMATLASLIAPSIADYTNEARQLAARKDVEAIGSGILQVLRDTGSRCLRPQLSRHSSRSPKAFLLWWRAQGAGIRRAQIVAARNAVVCADRERGGRDDAASLCKRRCPSTA